MNNKQYNILEQPTTFRDNPIVASSQLHHTAGIAASPNSMPPSEVAP